MKHGVRFSRGLKGARVTGGSRMLETGRWEPFALYEPLGRPLQALEVESSLSGFESDTEAAAYAMRAALKLLGFLDGI